ncbi:hypothetical protein B0A89_02045 [Paracoccus contaminans]|uniref:Lipid/polyisoprenoid-binding YceI-like domain-containing protein n=2 Tax=Paracoccus contaminans TaxID=1945662 RepID=A0A1W6D0T8_9RHOB|nr:hypothetical protein B0A89_02045 [Paracoccus contaminans]
MSASILVLALASGGPVLAQTAAAPAPAAPAPAAMPAPGDVAGTYVFDPDHSQIVFSYDHMGFSTSRGTISGINGQVTLDKADPAKSAVEARFPLSAIRTIAPALDQHLAGDKSFFNGAAPDTQVTFKSTSVKVDGDDEAEVTGDLTLNGVTKPVTLEVEITKAGDHPMTGKPTLGFVIEGKLNRSDFNLGAFAPAVSDEVTLEISVEASRG